MTQQNNTRFKVVFLLVLVFTVVIAKGLPASRYQAYRPSSLDEVFEGNQPHHPDASIPTYQTTKQFSLIPATTYNIKQSLVWPLGVLITLILGVLGDFSIILSAAPGSINLDYCFIKSKMVLGTIINPDNRTNTNGTFVPYDSCMM